MAPPPWVILARVVRVRLAPGGVEAGEAEQAEHAAAAAEPGFAAAMALPPRLTALAAGVEAGEEEHAAAAAEPDFAAAVALPARVTVLAAGRGAHPDAEKPDGYPYIITAGSDYLLAHFAAAPSYGARFDDNPDSTHLVLVSRFNAAGGETTASAERVPDRAGGVPNLRNIGNVILYSCVGGDYRIAELQVDTGRDLATIVYLRLRSSHAEGWSTRQVAYPLSAEGRNWIPDGTVYADGTLWWFDLSWGILSCSATLSEANLLFHQFPGHAEDTTSVHTKRWVTASRGKLRYVAIIIPEGGGPARVSMWTRMMDDKGWNWYPKYSVSFEKIWNDKSYEETELPRNVPELVIVCPSNPDLVYFAVEKHIIGVNVPEHRVVDDKAFGQETLNMPGPPRPASGRYFIAWELPSMVARVHKIIGNLASKARDKEQQLLQERTAASSSAGGRLPRGFCFGTLANYLLTSNQPPNLAVKDIWFEDANEAFNELQTVIDGGGSWFAGMDTEFCKLDGVKDSRREPLSEEAHYQQVCRIVDEGDLVQVGIVLSDADQNVVSDKIFQFNLEFHASNRSPDSGNVGFLRDKAKLKLEEHATRGIPVHYFFTRLAESGLIGNKNVTWVTFQGYSDYGYLIKGIEEAAGLPHRREEFLGLVDKYFPVTYDLKVFHKLGVHCTPPDGSVGSGKFENMAFHLGVKRIGQAHGAGSDAHLTLSCYHHMLRSHPVAATDLSRYANIVYGVSTCTPSAPRSACAPTIVHVWNYNFDTQVKLFSTLFGRYNSIVSVEVFFENPLTGRLASYAATRTETALSGAVQVGIAISDENGQIAYGRIWVFHIKGQDQVCGDGITPARLAHMLTSTRAILNPAITWCSSGSVAFIYLVNALTRSGCLPLELQGFIALVSAFFPNVRLLQVNSLEANPAVRALVTLCHFLAPPMYPPTVFAFLYDLSN